MISLVIHKRFICWSFLLHFSMNAESLEVVDGTQVVCGLRTSTRTLFLTTLTLLRWLFCTKGIAVQCTCCTSVVCTRMCLQSFRHVIWHVVCSYIYEECTCASQLIIHVVCGHVLCHGDTSGGVLEFCILFC